MSSGAACPPWPRAADPATARTRLRLPRWYNEDDREGDLATGTALWSRSGRPPAPRRWVLIRDPRHPFPAHALLCTDQEATLAQVLSWFALRWQREGTVYEVRDHPGVGTQRQWSDLAIRRVTPALLVLFSFVTLLAHDHLTDGVGLVPVRRAAWYPTRAPTFSDAIALVRRSLWTRATFCTSPLEQDIMKAPPCLPRSPP